MDETGEPTATPRSGDSPGETRDWGGAAEESLRQLEARLTKASEAAERLMREAADRVGGERRPGGQGNGGGAQEKRPPEAGWQESKADPARGSLRSEDLELLGTILDRVRDLIPPELQRRLAEAFRELLLALRSLIDWYLERVEQRRASPPKPRDIPIE